jgi:RimJ/RimL family protein N-acetyltransferase
MDDLAAFVALETALRSRREPPGEPPVPADCARLLAAFVDVWERGELGYWTIRYDGAIAGFGGVKPKLWRGRDCWNLYFRLEPRWWGLGIATEMAREAVAVAAATHPSWPVLVETRPDNAAAIRVAERAGLTRRPAGPGDEYAVLLLEP